MICAEVSLYPQKTTRASEIINASIEMLARENIDYSVGSLSTHLHGSEEEVWKGLRRMFEEASRSGEVSMVVTISNAVH
ncbi:MAG: thiamine-binding protein [Thermoanaerobacteraceae bacterium]|nr:thiamine-binding protein [Thermoanaerobacteraceae bacterium]